MAKTLEYTLRLHTEEHKKQLDAMYGEGKHDFKSFEDYLEDFLGEVVDKVYELIEEKGFYHADQINAELKLEYQENEG